MKLNSGNEAYADLVSLVRIKTYLRNVVERLKRLTKSGHIVK